MKALLQRVLQASVAVDGLVCGEIGLGLLVFLGVGRWDSDQEIAQLVKKILQLRIFDDEVGKMNLSIKDTAGSILVISQFTLFADTRKGNRPSYTDAAPPEIARALYEKFLAEMLKNYDGQVAQGVFGAEMKVSLVNDGPVTIMLDTDRGSVSH